MRFVVLEALVALATLGIVFWSGEGIGANPLDRLGQVSILAAMHFRVALLALSIVAIVAILWRFDRSRPWHAAVLWPAATALVTGFYGSVVAVTQRGTDWPIGGDGGDIGAIREWILDSIHGTGGVPPGYPPLFPAMIERLTRWNGADPGSIMHHAQFTMVLAMGPIAYFAWRIIMPPMPAAAFAIVVGANFVEPYKPYAALSLVVMVPVLAAYVLHTRLIPMRRPRANAMVGALLGASIGLMTILYSGWLFWVAPGVFVLLVAVTPWRRAGWRVAAFHVAGLLAFLAMTSTYLVSFARMEEPLKDTFFYFDTYIDPAYFAMWRGGQGGYDGPWPPFGEFGGVGLFTVLLVLAMGAALALRPRNPVVLVGVAMFASSWVMRFQVAQHMWQEQAVQLYPRTSYTLYLAAMVAAMVLVCHVARRLERTTEPRPLAASFGVFLIVVVLGVSAASAGADRHMPRDDETIASLAWRAYEQRNPDGTCPDFGADPACRDKPIDEDS